MSLTPNIKLFANDTNSSTEQNVLIRCTEEVYKILRKSNQISDDSLYFATYDKTPSSNIFISDHLYMGKKLIGNSGVIFIEATNGYAIINNIQVNLTTPTNLTSAITGVPGQVLFVVNHSIDELNNKDQYNTFVYLWKPIYSSKNESNTDDGEWINANINCTLDGIDIDGLGVAKLNLDNILPEEPKIDTLYVVSSDSNKPINAINKSLYIYDPDTQSWVSLMGGVGRDSVDADCSHKFNDYDNNYVNGNYSNSFNESNGVSGEASNGMGYKTHTTESAALTTGIRNYNYSTAGLVSGINNTVGINYTYVSHYYADDSTSTYYLYLNNKYNNLSEINVINFKLNSPIIFTSDLDRQDNILDLSDESFNNLYVCRITDYHQNYNLLIVDKIPDILKNNFTEYVDAEGNNTKNFYINEGCICKFFQPNNSAGCSIPSSLNNLDSDDVIHPGSANVVGGSNNVVQATNTIVVGKNLYASNNDAAYFGKYNKDEPNSILIIGNGQGEENRQNALTIYNNGLTRLNVYNPILDYITYTISNDSVIITGCDTSISGDYELPKFIDDYPVTLIGENAFKDCQNLNNLIIPDTVTSIGKSAFQNTYKLESFYMPDSVTSIGTHVFLDSGLKKLHLSDSLTSVPVSTCNYCRSLESFNIPKNATSISSNTFVYTVADCVVIPHKVVSIGSMSFWESSFTKIYIPKSVKSVDNSAFMYCEDVTDIYYEGSESEFKSVFNCFLTETNTGINIWSNANLHCNVSYADGENNINVKIDNLSSSINSAYSDLELRVAELEYNPIDIVTFKFNNNSSYTGEVGGVLSGGFNLNWSFNTTNYLTSLTLTSSKAILNGSSSVTLSLSNTNYSVSTDLSIGTTIGSTSITLKAIDNRNATDSATVYIYCYNKIYWGASTIPNVYNSSFILGLSGTLANSVAKTVNITTGSNQYMYYCVPTRLGKCAFKVGGFDGGFEEPQTISFTNTNGYTENYYIYRSTNSNLGTQSVVVSKGA